VHELKRPARNAAELMALAGGLQAAGIQLELLTGPLTGIYDPNGMGAILFAVLTVGAQLDRDYIRDKTIAAELTTTSGKNAGKRPSVATLYRALAEAEAADGPQVAVNERA
jgi:DNA invertase Pin-like site-specific DNA recombinase